jgi:hypothetical protein
LRRIRRIRRFRLLAVGVLAIVLTRLAYQKVTGEPVPGWEDLTPAIVRDQAVALARIVHGDRGARFERAAWNLEGERPCWVARH